MSLSERYEFNPDQYEAGKEFLVTPERLCRQGVYSLMVLKRNWSDPERAAVSIPARIADVHREREKLHVVSYRIEVPNYPDIHRAANRVIVAGSLVSPHFTGLGRVPIEEAYFAHQTDEIDDELQDMLAQEPLLVG